MPATTCTGLQLLGPPAGCFSRVGATSPDSVPVSYSVTELSIGNRKSRPVVLTAHQLPSSMGWVEETLIRSLLSRFAPLISAALSTVQHVGGSGLRRGAHPAGFACPPYIAVARNAQHGTWERVGSMALGCGTHLRMAESVSPSPSAV